MSTCQCSMAISMLGDGCRYCQPQTYIEHLLETLEDARAAPVSEAKAQGVVMPEHKTPAPSSKWAAAGEPDPHGKAYDCERAELSMGEYTDDELANAVFMHDHRSFDIAATMRGEPGSIVLLTAAKERIRWLSRSLDKALALLNATHVQQVSAVPKGAILVGLSELALVRNALLLDCEQGRPVRGEMLAMLDSSIEKLDMLAAAPAAPAADAGLVEALEKLARLGNGDKYGNSDGNLIAQAAIAAHIVKGEA